MTSGGAFGISRALFALLCPKSKAGTVSGVVATAMAVAAVFGAWMFAAFTEVFESARSNPI